MRNDQRYTQESMIAMNDFFNANYDKAIPTGAEARIFTAGYFKDFLSILVTIYIGVIEQT